MSIFSTINIKQGWHQSEQDWYFTIYAFSSINSFLSWGNNIMIKITLFISSQYTSSRPFGVQHRSYLHKRRVQLDEQIILLMQGKYCEKHHRQATIIDLNLSQLLCERCALFDPLYSSHKFIDVESLPEHASNLYREFQKDIASLNISVDKDAISNWRVIQEVAIEIFKEKCKELNTTYDEMIAQVQRERSEMMLSLEDQMKRIVFESNQSVNYMVREKYHQLYCKNKYLGDCIKAQKYLLVESELLDKSAKTIIVEIEKELAIVEIDLRQKLKNLNCSQLTLSEMVPRRLTFGRDELLLPLEQKQQKHLQIEFDFPPKSDRVNSHCKTEASYPTPTSETERISVETVQSAILFQQPQPINQLINPQLTASSISLKNVKNINNKAEIKGLVIKNTIKQVNLTNLSINNREALQAIRKCSFGTFVNRIDLSGNELSTQLLVLLKKEKIHSKYLKSIAMKGIKIDQRILKKEGVNLQKLAEGKLQLGDIWVQLN